MAQNNFHFIAIEGGEGSGKSTLVQCLRDTLGDRILATREPGGSPYAEVIREVALKNSLAKSASAKTMLSLMFAARFDHVDKVVIPTLAKGMNVVTDRFDASTFAYQVHAQSDQGVENLFWAMRQALPRVPDLYVFIDVDPVEGLRRAHIRNVANADSNHFDDRELEFHKKVRKGYLEFFAKVKHEVVDANRPLDLVKKDFLDLISKNILQK